MRSEDGSVEPASDSGKALGAVSDRAQAASYRIGADFTAVRQNFQIMSAPVLPILCLL